MPQTDRELSDLAAKLSPPSLPFSLLDMAPVRLRPADFARLMGITRARVSQMVKHGSITALPDGSIDPNTAVRELIRANPRLARGKVLAEVRAALEDAANQVAAAAAERDRVAGIAAESMAEASRLNLLVDDLRLGIRTFHRESAELAWIVDEVQNLRPRLDDGCPVDFDTLSRAAAAAPLRDLVAASDPDLLGLAARLAPDILGEIGPLPEPDCGDE